MKSENELNAKAKTGNPLFSQVNETFFSIIVRRLLICLSGGEGRAKEGEERTAGARVRHGLELTLRGFGTLTLSASAGAG